MKSGGYILRRFASRYISTVYIHYSPWTIAHFLFCIFKCVLQGIDQNETRPVYNTRNSYMPYSLRIVCGFFYVPMFFFFVCEQKRVEWQGLRFIALIREEVKVQPFSCSYKGSTFSSFILRPWVLVRRAASAKPTEPSLQSDWLLQVWFIP